jgi:hypothetical protein
MNECNRSVKGWHYWLVNALSLSSEAILICFGPCSLLLMFLYVFAIRNELDNWLELRRICCRILSCQLLLLPCISGVFLFWRGRRKLHSFLGGTGVIISVGCTVAVSLLLLSLGNFLLLDHEYHLRKIRAETAKTTTDINQLAAECILLLGNYGNSKPTLRPKPGDSPPLISSLRPVFVEVRSNSINILLVYRPFDPVGNEGFCFTKDPDKDVYQLEWYGEYDKREVLLTVPIKE